MTALATILLVTTLFTSLYPRVMVASKMVELAGPAALVADGVIDLAQLTRRAQP